MQVIIVEDHAFNAYCLTSLLQEVNPQVTVTLITNSLELNDYLSHSHADLIILDGDLGASDGLRCNGPAVADSLLQTNPMIPLIVWTSSPAMRAAFASVFAEHQLRLSDDNCWPKMVSTDRIRHSLKTCSSNCRSNTHIYQPIRARL
ncbi:two component sensor and regulator histidine kinase response regulator [Legionella birminghamensis]|uniref:Two component sensor and regulator histidine kinase response regulator n=1 Tax=Legionella birminghamensis TaxID=28083 RepID=A0A378I6C3_9GAMM|nr:response regulator [Legionella birminghamensis]KTC70180.1 two component sensor and regulator histidine kinase response regulator [Legionella birminghamensis]STX30412.1 two component sensor and regulator, histidine kinase response regulator [Legionella birminghamensis]